MIRRHLLLFALVLCAGCAGSPKPLELEEVSIDFEKGGLIPVLYGTDRGRDDTRDPDKFYGTDRGQLEYGIAGVSNSGKKFRLESVVPMTRNDFLAQLDTAMNSAGAPSVMVFIHGYNRSFRDVIQLVGEFSEMSGFEGVAVAWNWPSVQNPAGYVADQNNMRWSQPHFAEFLQTLFDNNSIDKVHLVGHSMGGWGLTRLFTDGRFVNEVDLNRLGEFVLMAPDIDKEVFRRDLVPKLTKEGLRVSLYVSSNDRAMASSRALNGHPRAGDSEGGAITLPGMETIDVSESNASILGHSYFEESESVNRDFVHLLNTGTPAAFRSGMSRVDHPDGTYWRLVDDD